MSFSKLVANLNSAVNAQFNKNVKFSFNANIDLDIKRVIINDTAELP